MPKTFLFCEKSREFKKRRRLTNFLLKEKLPHCKSLGRFMLIERLAQDVTTPDQIVKAWGNLKSWCGKDHFMRVFKKRANQFDATFWTEVLNLFVDGELARLARARLNILNGTSRQYTS